MVKIDLITGFLGSGKTTFIKKYAKYLMDIGEKICIIENDYGAINVDVLFINEIGCDIETVQGGCDYDCHKRRFKTKLIAAAMSGHTRVIVEPSGIFDPDEFFDMLFEDPLTNWYEIGNVFTLYDINTKNLSSDSEYILVSEASICSKLIVSKRDNTNQTVDLSYINSLMKKYKCERVFTNDDVIYSDNANIKSIINAGLKPYQHIKLQVINENNYDSCYILDKDISISYIKDIKNKLLNDKSFGNIIRIKGFILENNNWYKINITRNEEEISKIDLGQKVLIVIGENLDKEKIENLF